MTSPFNLVFHQHGMNWCSLCSWKDLPYLVSSDATWCSLYCEDGSYENGLISLHAFWTLSMTRNHTEVLEASPLCRLSALSPSRFHAYPRLFFSIDRRQHRPLQFCCWSHLLLLALCWQQNNASDLLSGLSGREPLHLIWYFNSWWLSCWFKSPCPDVLAKGMG